jgi:hypothetical protein
MVSDPGAPTYRTLPWHGALVADLAALSTGLVHDPVAASAATSPLMVELRALDAALRSAASTRQQPHRPAGAAEARALATALGSRHPRGRPAGTPAVPGAAAHDGFTAHGKRQLRQRIRDVAAIAHAAARSIERNRRYRDTPMSTGASLYQAQDVPRLEALQVLIRAARALAARAALLPDDAIVLLPARRSVLAPGSRRPLSALYERWVFFEIVRALHGPLDDAVLQSLLGGPRAGIGGDIAERAHYVRTRPDGRTIRVRFEPWVVTRELAIAGGHGVYRSAAIAHAWRPDVLIQVEAGSGSTDVPVVTDVWAVDAKLASAPRRELWEQVLKYGDIRAAIDDSPVVRSIALALPAPDAGGIEFFESLPGGDHPPLAVLPLLPGTRTRAGEEALRKLARDVCG